MEIMRSGEGRAWQQGAAGRPYWDPVGILNGLVGWWDPLGVLRLLAPARRFVPAFDVRDTRDAFILEADLPGIQQSQLEMSVTGTQLSVSGKRESGLQEETGKYLCAERAHGTFVRTFTLPDDADLDRASAEFRDGVLRVEIPRRPEAPSRRIPVTGARGDGNGGQRQLAGSGEAESVAAQRPRPAVPPPSRQRNLRPSTRR